MVMRKLIMFHIFTFVLYLQLSASLMPPSNAQLQQSSQISEFTTDYKSPHTSDEPKYAYHYYIDHPESMVHLHHHEERQGASVRGEYGLLEPGGYVRTVHYTVDGNGGFRAIVRIRAAAISTHQHLQLHQRQPSKPVQHAQPVAFIN